ncbi:hypothetical protein BDL97_14G100900 [Sphagnum fallax]|nr:hypothetical protein BDL97_14G100900 [Sphagnum fallax]
MGSFKGHVLPGTLFGLVGLWHLLNSIFNYVKDPKGFRGRVWHPPPAAAATVFAHAGLRYMELYIIIVGTFIDMCLEFFYSTHLRFEVDGALNTAHLNDFEHAAMLLMFFLFGTCVLISETTGWLPLPEGGLFWIASMAFTAEYLLFYFHSTSHAGLEGSYHGILVVLIGLCILASTLIAAYPQSFALDLAAGLALTLQGAWFYCTAYTLYGPLMPTGCMANSDTIVCETDTAEKRGQVFANVQLSVLVVCLWILVLFTFAIAAHFYGHTELFYPDAEPNEISNESNRPEVSTL